jgi:hypothetical protein
MRILNVNLDQWAKRHAGVMQKRTFSISCKAAVILSGMSQFQVPKIEGREIARQFWLPFCRSLIPT